jgi:hypothetical protein
VTCGPIADEHKNPGPETEIGLHGSKHSLIKRDTHDDLSRLWIGCTCSAQ